MGGSGGKALAMVLGRMSGPLISLGFFWLLGKRSLNFHGKEDVCVCVCVCVFLLKILQKKFLGTGVNFKNPY